MVLTSYLMLLTFTNYTIFLSQICLIQVQVKVGTINVWLCFHFYFFDAKTIFFRLPFLQHLQSEEKNGLYKFYFYNMQLK